MSFMAKVSDPKYGAVYLTVMQTIRALSALWPTFLSLALVDSLTFYKSDCVKEVSANAQINPGLILRTRFFII